MPKRLTERQKLVLRELVDFICQNCHKHEKEVGKLEVHRITRKVNGGFYTPNNIQMLCKNCHKERDFI